MSLDLKLKLPKVSYSRGITEGVHNVRLDEVEALIASNKNKYVQLSYTDIDTNEKIIHNLFLESKNKPEFAELTENVVKAVTNALAEQEGLEGEGTLADVLTIGHTYKVIVTRNDYGYNFDYNLNNIKALESFKNTDVAPF